MAKKTKKKALSANRLAFQKEQKRLRAAQRRLEKQGYYFTESMVPQMPKRVTAKALKEIQAMKPLDMRRKALWVDSRTGEVMGTGLELYAQHRRQTSAKLSKAGRRAENVNRLRLMAARRSGKPIRSYESYQREQEESYYQMQKMTAATYDEQVIGHWNNLFSALEANYSLHEIVESLTDVNGVPEPAYLPDPAYQLQQFFKFSANLMRAIKSLPSVKSQPGTEIPTEVEQAIQQISADLTDDYTLTEDDMDDLIIHDLKRGTTHREPRT